jgi:hypothetical protein
LPGACHRAALCADPLGHPGMTMRKELASQWLSLRGGNGSQQDHLAPHSRAA